MYPKLRRGQGPLHHILEVGEEEKARHFMLMYHYVVDHL
jgi:hypothetical protein